MKLVMIYSEGDGCTYSCENVFPIEYSSAEAALLDFEAACQGRGGFNFAGREFHKSAFWEAGTFYSPSFLTVDGWFAQECQPAQALGGEAGEPT